MPSGLKQNEILAFSEQDGATKGMCKEVKLICEVLSAREGGGSRCRIFQTGFCACAEPKYMTPQIPFEHFILIREFQDIIKRAAEDSQPISCNGIAWVGL